MRSINSEAGLVSYPSGGGAAGPRPAGLGEIRARQSIAPHFSFLLFGLLAEGLIIGAAVLELLIVRRAKQRWSEESAADLGLRFVFGTLTYSEYGVVSWYSASIVSARKSEGKG